MKKYLFPIVLAIPLALAACGQSDFKDESEKEEAFAAVQCKDAVDNDMFVAGFVAGQVLDDENVTEKDRRNARNLQLVSTEIVDSDWDYVLNDPDADPEFEPFPHYKVNPAGDDECFGWTWEKYLEIQMSGSAYDDFTFDDAKEAGVLEN